MGHLRQLCASALIGLVCNAPGLAQAQGSTSELAYTFQTLTFGEVQTTAITYTMTPTPTSCPCPESATATQYTLDPSVLAYPVYQNASPAEASSAPGPGLYNATDFINNAVKLVGLFQNANSTNCQTCKDVMTQVANTFRARQETLSIIAEPFCQAVTAVIPFNICLGLFHVGSTDVGAIFPAMDMQGEDGQTACAFIFGLCSLPAPPKLDLDHLFKGTTKPPPKELTSSGKDPLKVLHISDYHLDERFVVGSEASCGDGQVCCRVFPYTDTSSPINASAQLFGNYLCDTPEPLATSVFRSVPKVTGFEWCDFSFGIFTGDLVSHDIWELTPEYTLANELISYQQFFDGLGGVTIYPTLGNHDTYPQAFTAWPSQNDVLPDNASYPIQQQPNYEAVSAAFSNYGWLSASDAQELINTGLGIYRTKTAEGLVIISLNSDAWYYFNFYAYIGVNRVDQSGVLSKLIDYLLEAEAADDPVWIIQHVNVGGGGTYNALPAPSDLYYQIVDRFNNTIRGNFFGHTHSDEFGVFYTNNGTVKSADTAISVGWIMPSVTPYTNLNSGFRYYLVDPDTFYVMDAITYYANITNAPYWAFLGDAQWEFEYSARDTYDSQKSLASTDPLGPAFWHNVAEDIAANDTLFHTYTDLRQKLYRPYAEVTGVERNRTLCGLQSMSVPIFEDCLGNMNVISPFL